MRAAKTSWEPAAHGTRSCTRRGDGALGEGTRSSSGSGGARGAGAGEGDGSAGDCMHGDLDGKLEGARCTRAEACICYSTCNYPCAIYSRCNCIYASFLASVTTPVRRAPPATACTATSPEVRSSRKTTSDSSRTTGVGTGVPRNSRHNTRTSSFSTSVQPASMGREAQRPGRSGRH